MRRRCLVAFLLLQAIPARAQGPPDLAEVQIDDLFDQQYSAPGSDEHLPDAIQQTGRTMRIGFRWTNRAR